jgi:two-component system CheB/CheR fusion protein
LEHTPPSLIVNDKNEIAYFHGRTSKYLELTPGRASFGLQDMLRDDIRYAVMSTINESRSTAKTVIKEAVQIHTNGEVSFLNIIVKPLDDHRPVSDVLVIFDEKSIPQKVLGEKQELTITPNRDMRINELERELNYTKEDLKSTIEELETSNEELTSTNEELQSNNEELQSVVEESETGKEELNSLNEELLTVNTELERKNQDLSRINSDMRNLLNSIDEALIFLDNDLRIRRFTPQMEKIMNLLPGDVGRPIQDITMKLRYEDLAMDVKEVLDKLNTKEKEVQTKVDHWYKLKILPYRTIENVIDGAVMTFGDIDAQKKVQEKLKNLSLDARVAQEFAESIVNTIKEPLIILEGDLIVRSANTVFYKLFETAPEDIQGRPLSEILNGTWNVPLLISGLKDLSTKESELENLSTEIVIPKLGKKVVNLTARKLLILSGKSRMILVNINMKE